MTATSSSPQLKYAFRMTHIDNMRYIMEEGLVRASSPRRNPNYVNIGDRKVISNRDIIVHDNVRLADCLPFYFGPRSPMLYVIQHGYNGVEYVPPEKIVYCVVRLDTLIEYDVDLVFSDGHAVCSITKFYGKERLKDVSDIISKTDVYAKRWDSEADPDLKRRKEAELLIKCDLPPQYIAGFIVYNDEAKAILASLGISLQKIIVIQDYYFPA